MATDTQLFSKSLNDQVKYLWLLYRRVLATPAGSSAWGSITGTLSDQLDLQAALTALSITIDSTPTNGSANAVSSNGVYDELVLKAPIASPTFTTTASTPTLTVGTASATNGVITLKNAAGATDLTLSSTGAKQLLIDNTGHDVIVGINGAAVAGKALAIVGDAQISSVLTNTLTALLAVEIVDNTTTITQPAADEMLLTASAGVSTSANMLVGGTITTVFGIPWDLQSASAESPQVQDISILVNINGNNYSIHATAL